MKIVFSFDDGRSDFVVSSKILAEHGLNGSFHITTGFIDESFKTDVFGVGRKHLSIQDLLQMKKDGMDISSHGDKHIMETNDFQTSLDKLSKWGILSKEKTGFSIPNSKYTNDELTSFIKENKNSLLYIRGGRSPKCYGLLSKINYVLYKAFKWQIAYNNFNKHNLNESISSQPLYSVVITNNIKSKSVIKFIEKYKNKDKVLVLMFHSVVEKPIDRWEYSIKAFTELCDYVKALVDSNQVEVGSLLSFVSSAN